MFPAPFSIRDKLISPGTVLAPMAGVTDTVFRRMIRSLGGCGLIMTEFTSAECITRNNARTSRYLFFEPDEHPITGQLFGADADVMGRAAGMVASFFPKRTVDGIHALDLVWGLGRRHCLTQQQPVAVRK